MGVGLIRLGFLATTSGSRRSIGHTERGEQKSRGRFSFRVRCYSDQECAFESFERRRLRKERERETAPCWRISRSSSGKRPLTLTSALPGTLRERIINNPPESLSPIIRDYLLHKRREQDYALPVMTDRSIIRWFRTGSSGKKRDEKKTRDWRSRD